MDTSGSGDRPEIVAVIGAAGPTGLQTCLTALAAGYQVPAVSRRDDPLPLPDARGRHRP